MIVLTWCLQPDLQPKQLYCCELHDSEHQSKLIFLQQCTNAYNQNTSLHSNVAVFIVLIQMQLFIRLSMFKFPIINWNSPWLKSVCLVLYSQSDILVLTNSTYTARTSSFLNCQICHHPSISPQITSISM